MTREDLYYLPGKTLVAAMIKAAYQVEAGRPGARIVLERLKVETERRLTLYDDLPAKEKWTEEMEG